ncbi:MAG: ribosomal protein S18-alanine N-acetyltransferase, partial [Gammaproteobacteria bacterium]
ARGAETMFLEVRPSNRRAQQLYARAGFKEIGLRPDYYPAHEGREDALTLALPLPTRG